jgi:hypothetical protein
MRRSPATEAVLARRAFLRSGFGLGSLALASLLGKDVWAQARARARAQRVIVLFMAGGPSQLDLFAPKPRLVAHHGQPLPPSVAAQERFAFIKGPPQLLGSPFRFRRHGGSGAPVSSLMPHLARVVDKVAFLHAVHTTQFNHGPAQIFMSTGHQMLGRPSLGAWLSYGLGSENRDLPEFVVMLSGERQPDGGRSCWGSGFLPTVHQGVELASRSDPVLFLSNPPGVTPAARRQSLDALNTLNRRRLRETGDPEIESRIQNYELAFRMQSSVPELASLDGEPASVHALYGTTPGRSSFANNCLLARRLIERGCRTVQLFHRGWDTHGTSRSDDLMHQLPILCRDTDQATAALLLDLEARGLLDSTLVVWGGEFGRTPMVEGRNGSLFLGRDHHPRSFSVWLAGGGIRPGVAVGETDDLGYHAVKDAVSVHDLHATMLHLLGLDHEQLTYPFEGRRFRLTDVSGEVIHPICAA